jgi:hypothetical protein
MRYNHRGEREIGIAEPGRRQRVETDGAQHGIEDAPVIVEDPHPQDRHDDIGEQHRGEPRHAQEAGAGYAGIERERQKQARRHVEDRGDERPDEGVAHGDPEGLVSEQLPVIAETHEGSVQSFDGEKTIEDGAESRIGGQPGINEDCRGKEYAQHNPACAAGIGEGGGRRGSFRFPSCIWRIESDRVRHRKISPSSRRHPSSRRLPGRRSNRPGRRCS